MSEQLVALLYEAAYRIEADAQALEDAHTHGDGDWTGEPLAQAEYLDDMRLATRLRQAAEELEAAMPMAERRQCPVCGDWFEIRPPTTRRTKVYCSDNCRVKAHQARKAQATQDSWRVM